MADVTSNTDRPVSLGQTIRDRRQELEMTVEVCAVKAKVAAKTVSRVEAGEDIRVATVNRILEVLGLELVAQRAS